jgi:hypothetical protein
MEKEKPNSRPVGHINIHDPRGYGFIPQIIRKELGIDGKGRIPYFLDANIVLLIRKDATRQDILKGLDILKEDLKLRWKEEEPNHER